MDPFRSNSNLDVRINGDLTLGQAFFLYAAFVTATKLLGRRLFGRGKGGPNASLADKASNFAIGDGTSLVKLHLGFNADWGSGNVFDKLTALSAGADTGSKPGLARFVSDVCMELLRRSNEWASASCEGAQFRSSTGDDLDALAEVEANYTILLLRERSKIMNERCIRSGENPDLQQKTIGDTSPLSTPDLLYKDGKDLIIDLEAVFDLQSSQRDSTSNQRYGITASTEEFNAPEGAVCTAGVVTLIVAMRGKASILEQTQAGGIKARQGESFANLTRPLHQVPTRDVSGVQKVLQSLALDTILGSGQRVLAAELMWTPGEKGDVLDAKEVIVDFPSLISI